MELARIVHDIADAVIAIDQSGVPFKHFKPGVGPYGEPQLARAVAQYLDDLPRYRGLARTKRCPDLLIAGHWAIEFKLARPFGDNGKEAENWSVNLLHPYEGSVSVIGDCLKLCAVDGPERKAVVVIGYEHTPPLIPLAPLFHALEVIAREVLRLQLSQRVQVLRCGLSHPVHQQCVVAAWEVQGRSV
ncbi:MAG TPA: hypothetical protein VJK29_15505 [Terriglobales bacterium]|nr:hypothetical protein [Terriglobales bacterium]